MRFAGLFAGIGGFELGFAKTGHRTDLLCDVNLGAEAVLKHHFADVPYHFDITTLKSLPSEIDAICAGFPCQDLSQAGRGAGLHGQKSGLIAEVFRLLSKQRIPTVVIENVPFMLQLNGGAAMKAITDEFERMGYRWAYRVVDTFAFGLPQRRERVFLVASRHIDPAAILFVDETVLERPKTDVKRVAHGFYWTEGLKGLGWAVDSIPTLKNGSTIGIPSPPAVLLPNGKIVKPSIRDAERLQGFEPGWTEPAENVVRQSFRWSLIGSAVSVPVAEWLGRRLTNPGTYNGHLDSEFTTVSRLPRSARFDGKRRYLVSIGVDPIGLQPPSLSDFLLDEGDPLSLRATLGFLTRTRRAKLKFDEAFIAAVEQHVQRLGGELPPRLR